MSKTKKSTPSTSQEATSPHHDNKGFLNLAGEAFVVLGAEIAEGKDKVIEVVGEKITTLKSAISNLTHKKKKAKPNKPVKAAPKKALPAKAAAKKSPRKAAPSKKKPATVKKKPTAAKKKPAAVKKKAAAKKPSKKA
jgi:hypothetical protein